MPIIAQYTFGINITPEHIIERIVFETLSSNSCFDKKQLAEDYDIGYPELEDTLLNLTKFGLIKCSDEKCCIDSTYMNDLSAKLKKLQG
uniref:TFIIEalpha/SarR/Rpc3 HTH domain-containing protein n=1 Tax=viral metagenome TaxID=1070528 RepID=A0A6M3Y5C5_9ZZZZ